MSRHTLNKEQMKCIRQRKLAAAAARELKLHSLTITHKTRLDKVCELDVRKGIFLGGKLQF